MRVLILVLAFAVLAAAGQPAVALPPAPVEPADMVVRNAKMFTSNPRSPRASACAIRGGRFVYVGANRGADRYIGPNTEVLDAAGRMVTPGFIDNHCHTIWMGAVQAVMGDGYEARTLAEFAEVARTYAAENPDDPFVGAIGWRYEYIPGEFPTKELADAICSERPMFLWCHEGHSGWVNSRMLEIMQRNQEAYQQLTPHIDPNTGEATGFFYHFYSFNFLDYFSYDELPPQIYERMEMAVRTVMQYALSFGVTGLNDVQVYETFLPVLARMNANGAFDNVRARGAYYISHHVPGHLDDLERRLNNWIAFGQAQNNDHLRVGDSVKLYIDGTIGNYTSFMREPYSDNPGEYGYSLWTQQDFDDVIGLADRLGLQACTHGIGDAGIDMVINAYAAAATTNGVWDSRHRIEHCEYPLQQDIDRMAVWGIHAAVQPSHMFGDEVGESRVGPERLERLIPNRSFMRAGVPVSFGSDWCAAPINPIYGLIMATTRTNYKGTKWGAREAIGASDAIRNYTMGSARALKMEDRIGSIETGKFGDLVVWNENLMQVLKQTYEIPSDELDEMAMITVVGGRIVFDREQAGR